MSKTVSLEQFCAEFAAFDVEEASAFTQFQLKTLINQMVTVGVCLKELQNKRKLSRRAFIVSQLLTMMLTNEGGLSFAISPPAASLRLLTEELSQTPVATQKDHALNFATHDAPAQDLSDVGDNVVSLNFRK